MKQLSIEEIIKMVNELPFVEYDITMCNHNGCAKKEKCHRYIMCQAYKNDKRKDKPRFFSLYKGDSEKCTLFWEHKNTKS